MLTPRRVGIFCLMNFFLLSCVTNVASAHDHVKEMTDTVKRIVTTLSEAQKTQCLFDFNGEQRKNWNFVPDKFIQPGGKRLGLVLTDMTTQQRLFTHALLNSVLSNEGYRQTVTIMSLEQVLHELENQNPIRDPQRYYLSIYGSPEDTQWGWRFEGHHLSLNFTIKDGKLVSATPSFFGTNPAEVREGNMTGLKTLATEEELARKLLASLDEKQQEQAIVASDAPADILTGTSKEVDLSVLAPGADKGLKVKDMNLKQQAMLQQVVDEYFSTFESQALPLTGQHAKVDSETVFAWLGSTQPGNGHYYRIKSERFVLEYDNTQNNANHVHIVWRDLDNDFGGNLLQKHLQEGHDK